MKNLYTFFGIIIVCFGILSGCKTLFDVVPSKGIYSPIELQKNVYRDYNSQGPIDAIVIKFSITDPSLSYGALVFYDSASAAAFVLERTIVGQAQAVTAVKSLTTNVMSTTVGYDNTRGQYIYVTPFAFKSEKPGDSTNLATLTINDYKKVFSSQTYMRLKISPWTHVTDLPGPVPSIYDDKPFIFAANNKLFCIKNEGNINSKPPRFTHIYEFDPTAQIPQWTSEKKFENKFCQVCESIQGKPAFIDRISEINNVYFANDEYHLIGSITKSVINPDAYNTGTYLVKYTTGEVVTDKNFVPKTTGVISEVFSTTDIYNGGYNYILTDVQGDKATVIQRLPNDLKKGEFLTKGYRDNLITLKRIFYEAKEDIGHSLGYAKPNFSCVISNKLMVNSYDEENTFRVYDLNDVSLKYLNVKSYNPNILWSSNSTTGSPIRNRLTISQGDRAFVLNDILNIYKVRLNSDNTPYFSSIYSGWLPATSSTAFNQGIALGSNLWFIINNKEIWTINPDVPYVTFTSGDADAVKIVNL